MTENKQSSNNKRLTATFDGRVQGVGFRFTTVEIARNCNVTGFVQNMMNGSVTVVAEGSEDNLFKLLRELREAHIYRHVTSEDIHWRDATGEFEAFIIRYT